MIQDFIAGLTSYGKAFRDISKYRLWKYVLVPGIISLVLGIAIFSGAWAASDNIGGWLISFYPFEWGSGWIEKVANVFGGLLVGVTGLLLFKYIVMIVASPFMSFLSESIEKKMYGSNAPSPNLQMIISDMVRGIRIALRNIIRELFFTFLIFLAGIIIPILSPVVPIVIFIVQAYYAGFGNMDFTLERYYRVKGSVAFVRDYKGLAIGNGTIFLLLLLTGVGFLFALPLGTVAATTETLKRLPETPDEEV
jgi:CysZ protein